MLATFDDFLQLRDFYYPFVGMEDHTTYGKFHRIGFFADGRLSWTSDHTWEIEIGYHSNSLVSDCRVKSTTLGLEARVEDFVYTTRDILFRRITVKNNCDHERTVRVFLHHDFHIFEDKAKDTAQYEPDLNAILHYRQSRYFLISGRWEGRNGEGLKDYAVGKIGYAGLEGTFKDAEDGMLSNNPVEQGSVDSTAGFGTTLKAGEEKSLLVWVAAGKSYEAVAESDVFIKKLGPKKLYSHTLLYWQEWLRGHGLFESGLPASVEAAFNRSLLTIRTQTDNRGAIIAANDSDNMRVNRDTYTYMWPRDGALVALALIRAGYEVQARRFLEFCQRVITSDGFMLHKYNPDGTPGSTWHPKLNGSRRQLPIQEDETALILVALAAYYEKFGVLETVQENFHELILNTADFMCGFIDEQTGLPLPTYDLWEEQHGVFSYTVSCIFAGLSAAARLAEATGHLRSAKKYTLAANRVRNAALKYLYDEKAGRFVKRRLFVGGRIGEADLTVDASLAFVFKLGLVKADDPRALGTMRAIAEHLKVSGPIGGIARYQNDYYHFDHSLSDRIAFPGNPWIITTLWTADHEIALAKQLDDLDRPLQTLQWAAERANRAGMLPEQVHPLTGQPLSVAPLTWSHAAFVETVLLWLDKRQQLKERGGEN